MSALDWLNDFKTMHQRFKLGSLGAGERDRYQLARDECVQVVLSLQNRGLEQGHSPRRNLRVSRALPVHMEFPEHAERAVTLEVSTGGFGAFVGHLPRRGDVAMATLRLPGGDPLTCHARVVGIQKLGPSVRASLEFVDLDEAQGDRLETFLFDAVLAGLHCDRPSGPLRAASVTIGSA